MTDDQKDQRRQRIEAAALEILEEIGYRKASMLQIAKRAQASNETLYAWYGNKQGLFSDIIKRNAETLKLALDKAIAGTDKPEEELFRIGILLLEFTATDKAIIVNRAAVADVSDTGLLADAIQEHARNPTLQRMMKLMQSLEAEGQFKFPEGPEEAVGLFLSALLGELQIQQALGAMAPLSAQEIDLQVRRAVMLFKRVYGSGDTGNGE